MNIDEALNECVRNLAIVCDRMNMIASETPGNGGNVRQLRIVARHMSEDATCMASTALGMKLLVMSLPTGDAT